MEGLALDWALAITAPRAEFKVAAALRQHDIAFHLFKIRETITHRGKLCEREIAAFPRYVFVNVVEGLYQVAETIHHIIDFARDYSGMMWHGGDRELTEILARVDAEGFLPVQEIPCPFHNGQRVVMRGDSLIAGSHAVFQRIIGGGRAIVEQQWLGRYVPIVVYVDDLEPTSERRQKKRRHRRRRSR